MAQKERTLQRVGHGFEPLRTGVTPRLTRYSHGPKQVVGTTVRFYGDLAFHSLCGTGVGQEKGLTVRTTTSRFGRRLTGSLLYYRKESYRIHEVLIHYRPES